MSEQPKPLSAEEEGLLRNLVSRSSPGPWRERYAYLKHPPGTLIAATAPGHQVVSDEPGGTMPSADLAFIAAARIGVVRLFATLDAERARADAAERALRSYTREARKCQASFTADPPVDCDWPNCGCDPHAERVMDGLRESGWRSLEEYLQQVERADAAERDAAAMRPIVEAARALVRGIPYTMGAPGDGGHNALRDAVNALDLTEEVMPNAGADHSEAPELHAVTGDAHPNHAEMLEDWQECASHLVLAIKNQFHEESRTDEMREALAEFDRLASEATKGAEF